MCIRSRHGVALILGGVILLALACAAHGDEYDDRVRELIGIGWESAPHGQTLASDVLGQFANGNPSRPSFGSYGPYGGPSDHGFFFFAFNAGRGQTLAGMAAHLGTRKVAVPDFWNHRVLLFDLKPDGSLASRRASGLIGQKRFDQMEIGRGPDRFHYPSDCAFDPAGKFLFVADELNQRVLQFDMSAPKRAIRVYGQRDFQAFGYNAATQPTKRELDLVANPPNSRGFLIPRGVACDGKRIFVSDCENNRVMVFDMAGTTNGPEAIAVLGQEDFRGRERNRGGAAAMNTLRSPSGLALDQDNTHLLVADSMNLRVLLFDIRGEITNGMNAIAALNLPPPEPDEDDAPASQPAKPKPRTIDSYPGKGAIDVATDPDGRVFVADHTGLRVVVYDLKASLVGDAAPRAALGRFDMMSDLDQTKSSYAGPNGLACAGRFVYVAEPRGNRVLCFDGSRPDQPAVNVLGQLYGNDLNRPDFHKYGPNNGPDPYGFDFADGTPAVSVTADGNWLLAADAIGGRMLFFPLNADGLPLDHSARLAMGVSTLTARANNYGADHFNRSGFAVLSPAGGLFATDFQGSRVLHFELPDFAAASGPAALQHLRPFIPPTDRKPENRESFEFRSIHSGVRASHVLGQADFQTGTRDQASVSQLGKEMSGLSMDRDRGWLFVTDKLNHRVVIFDVSKGVSDYMPAIAVLGQPDFDHNTPNWGMGTDKNNSRWHPRGMAGPHSACYDQSTKRLFVLSGARADREILCFDLSSTPTNGMEPAFRIGGAHATVKTDLPVIGNGLAIDEKNRRLWSNFYALDISHLGKGAPVIGYVGPPSGPPRGTADHLITNRLGYAIEACHRFGTAVNTTAVNPRTGTLYAGDLMRYRILCFQPEFHFESELLKLIIGQRTIGLTGSGGLQPLEFDVDAKTVPAGLQVDSQTGIITGTPTDKPGEYQVKVTVKTPLGQVSGSRTIELVKE
jgi:sugar lactone lactonase YvrE